MRPKIKHYAIFLEGTVAHHLQTKNWIDTTLCGLATGTMWNGLAIPLGSTVKIVQYPQVPRCKACEKVLNR